MDKRRLLNSGLAERWAVAQENEQIQKKIDKQVKELKVRMKSLETKGK